jgi:uncharacterized protein YqjF (DUF2071 family)
MLNTVGAVDRCNERTVASGRDDWPIAEASTMIGALHMGWRHALFANWPVDPEVVRPHVPDALTLDTFDGRAWLSVVPYTNVDVRPRWFPTGWGVRLPELNLRTYVSHQGRTGVYFFSLDAHGLAGVLLARALHHLPYYYARTTLDHDGETIRFQSRRFHPGARAVHFSATYRGLGERFTPAAGELAHFLTERYRYYTESPSGRLRYADIDHEPWPLFDASVTIEENTLFTANGFDHPDTEPVHFYSPGVDTSASASREL